MKHHMKVKMKYRIMREIKIAKREKNKIQQGNEEKAFQISPWTTR